MMRLVGRRRVGLVEGSGGWWSMAYCERCVLLQCEWGRIKDVDPEGITYLTSFTRTVRPHLTN